MKTKYETNSEAFMSEARYYRNIGDEAMALRWEIQAEMEKAYEMSEEGKS